MRQFENTFRGRLETLLDEAFARVNNDREEWDPALVAEEIMEMIDDEGWAILEQVKTIGRAIPC